VREGERDIVLTPSIGDEIPLVLIITVLKQLGENLVKLCGSQVIWSVTPESIIQLLPLVTTERLRAELDILDLITNLAAIVLWLLGVASCIWVAAEVPKSCFSDWILSEGAIRNIQIKKHCFLYCRGC